MSMHPGGSDTRKLTLPVYIVDSGAVVEIHVTRQKNYRHRICNLTINDNSADKLRRPRSDAYSTEQVLLNKQQIW